MNYKYLILLFFALVLGGILRLFGLGVVPRSLYWDETAIGVDAYAVSTWGKDMHGNSALQAIYPSYGDYKLPLYILIDSLVVKLFGLSPWAVRLPSALAGIGLIYVIYLIAKQLFKTEAAGIIAAIVTAIIPVEILFSRTGFEGHLATLFVGCSLLLWLKSMKRPVLLLLASIFSTLAVYSYFSARIVIPLMGVVTLFSFFRKTTWQWKLSFVASFGLWALLLLPIFKSPFYEASNQFRLSTKNLLDVGQFAIESNIYREQSGNSIVGRLIYHRYLLQAKAIGINIATHFDPGFLFFTGDSNLRHSTQSVGLLYFSMMPLFIVGWWALFKKDASLGLWLFGLWLCSIIPAAIPLEVPHTLRSLNSVIVLSLIVGFGAYWLFKNHKLVLTIISFLVLLDMIFFIHDYESHYPSRSAEAWQEGYFQLADYLKQNFNNFDQVSIDYPDDRLYLYFLFENQTNPQEIAANTDHYMIKKIGKYHFGPVEETASNVWSVVSGDAWEELDRPPAHLIYRNDEIVFAILEEM